MHIVCDMLRGPVFAAGLAVAARQGVNVSAGWQLDTAVHYNSAGCSTKQIFPPDRPGDPTLQYLFIPPNSAEQAHHLHPTVRVVWVLEGHGTSVVGMDSNTVTEELVPGKVCILEPMCPHHFETPFGEERVVVPFHAFSTVPSAEANPPMFNGTFLVSQT